MPETKESERRLRTSFYLGERPTIYVMERQPILVV